jgi:hypothetical protein
MDEAIGLIESREVPDYTPLTPAIILPLDLIQTLGGQGNPMLRVMSEVGVMNHAGYTEDKDQRDAECDADGME